MSKDRAPTNHGRPVTKRTVRLPKEANDNWIDVVDELPQSVPIEQWELDVVETNMFDILRRMIPANDD